MRHLGLALLLLLPALPAVATIEGPALLEPPEAVRLLAETDETAYEDADRLVLFDRTEVEVEETGLSHVFGHRFVKVVDFGGARALRALRFDYDPATNAIEIRSVRVHRADSTYVDVDPSAAVDATAPAYLIYWGGRMKVLPLPPLEPGDGVEMITYKKGFQIAYLGEGEEDERYIPPMRGHFYDVVHFQDALPMLEKSYEVHVPRDKPLQYSIYNGEVMSSLTFSDQFFTYKFWKDDVPALVEEERMPDPPDVVAKVVMATVADWPEKSRWFHHVNEDRDIFAWTPEIKAEVDKITAGLKTDDKKIAALLHWVAQNIRYSGLNMGEGEGYTIHPGTMTFRDRAGVCKDIAGMLVTMLRAAGYPTFAAMTMAGSRVEAIPADQFNHCVVALQKEDGSYMMLDPTWAPWNNPLWSRWEGEQDYVIGSPEGEDRMMIPAFDPEDNLLAVRSEARIAKDGALEGTLTMEGKGISDGRLRGAVAYNRKKDVRSGLEAWLGNISERVELVDYRFSDHRDFTRDTTLRIRYRIPGYADLLGEEIAFSSPALRFLTKNSRLSRMMLLPDSDERVHPAYMWGPQKITIDETLTLPGGYKAEAPDPFDKEEEMASADLVWEVKGSRLTLSGSYSMLERTISAGAYAGVRDVARELKELSDKPLYASR